MAPAVLRQASQVATTASTSAAKTSSTARVRALAPWVKKSTMTWAFFICA